MPLRDEELKYLWDIKKCCENIFEFKKEIDSLKKFKGDIKTKKAIERDLITIGEAINQLRKFSEIKLPNQEKIIAFRNKLVHDYSQIEDDLVFAIITRHLEGLLNEVKLLLTQETD